MSKFSTIRLGNTATKSAENANKVKDRIAASLSKLDKDLFLPKANPFDWSTLSNEKMDIAVKLAYHCCVNGPVGVNTRSSFPGFDFETSIAAELKCTNAQWKGFCYEFKEHLSSDLKRGSKAVEMFGNFWPTETEMFYKKTFERNESKFRPTSFPSGPIPKFNFPDFPLEEPEIVFNKSKTEKSTEKTKKSESPKTEVPKPEVQKEKVQKEKIDVEKKEPEKDKTEKIEVKDK